LKTRWKVAIGLVVALAGAGGALGYKKHKESLIPVVQTGKVIRTDLAAIVVASGEIKPRNYVNIGSNSIGKIIDINVVEGQVVRRGQLLARLESVQAQADVEASKASVATAEAESAAAEASLKASDENVLTNEAAVNRAKAELQRAQLEFNRAEDLYKGKLIAKAEYETKMVGLTAQQAAVREAEARVSQTKAQKGQLVSQLAAAQRRVGQIRANLRRSMDVLDKFSAVAPLDGMVTNLPVRVGETVVPGIQNSLGTTIMTIADMSVITAEVKVDETDIVNVRLGQRADIEIEAMPNKKFPGKVIEIGNTALLRSTGLAASSAQNSAQEAKDFKVVIALDAPPAEIRPGLSCTARVTTANRSSVLAVPLQAVTARTKADLQAKKGDDGKIIPGTVNPADKSMREEVIGLWVVRAGKTVYLPVTTGISGATELEVTSGVNEGDEVVTGPFKSIRTLTNGEVIKVDNAKPEDKKS
jgi:HlyD family secretion protein